MRVKICFLLMVLLFFCTVDAYAEELAAATALQKTINYITSHQDTVWPGFQINTMPIIIQFQNNQHSYAFNFTPVNTLWKPLTLENKPVFVLKDDSLNLINNSYEIRVLDGQPVYIFQFEDNATADDIVFNIRNLIEKRFELYLTNESTLPRNSLNYWDVEYTEFNQLDNVEYTYLEYFLLDNYLLTRDIELLKNYLAVHHIRYNLLTKTSRHYEDISQIYFGVSAYVSFQALNLTPEQYTAKVLDTYEHSYNCPSYESIQDIEFCTIIAHYYLAGPALGTALDHATGNAWKTNVMQTMTTPVAQLEKLYPMTDAEINQRVAQAKQEFHFDQIKQHAEARLKFNLDQMRKLVHDYVSLPQQEINLDYRFCTPTAYKTKFREEFDISNNQTLFTYYEMELECHTSTSKIKVLFKRIPFIVKSNSILNNNFKAPPETILTINGVQQTLASYIAVGKNTNFKKFKIENKYMVIEIDGQGTINKVNNILKITSSTSSDIEKISLKQKKLFLAEKPTFLR